MTKARPLLLPASVCALAFWVATTAMIQRAYHSGIGGGAVCVAVAIPTITAFLICHAGTRIVGEMAFRALLVIAFVAKLLEDFANQALRRFSIEIPLAVAIAVGVATFLALRRSRNQSIWQLTAGYVAMLSVLFGCSPFIADIYSRLSLPSPEPLDFSMALRGTRSENSLVILFDELSPEYAGTLRDALAASGLHVRVGDSLAAGANTVNAIPAMLTGRRFDDVIECGQTSLCGRNSLDFSRLTVADANTDVVGYYHPYCAIRGLRSCFTGRPLPNMLDSTFFAWLRNKIKLRACEALSSAEISGCQGLREDDTWLPMRANMLRAVEEAPFWRMGGTLYAHLPLPHMPSLHPHETMKGRYEENVADAAQLLRLLAARLRKSFGSDFSLAIVSDHPLRTCPEATALRTDPECTGSLPINRGVVPVILATPTEAQFVLPRSNLGIFRAPRHQIGAAEATKGEFPGDSPR